MRRILPTPAPAKWRKRMNSSSRSHAVSSRSLKVTFKFHIPLLISLLLLGACASQPPITPPAEETAPEYPAISLYFKHPSKALARECGEFSRQSLLHHCNSNYYELDALRQHLSNSGKFPLVALSDDRPEFQVKISIVEMDQESGTEISNAALSGATLLLLPLVTEKILRAEVVINWQHRAIKKYDYTLPFSFSASLFTAANDYQRQLTARVAEQLLQDLEQEEVFSGSQVLAALNASDYDQGLSIPDAVEDYYFDEKHIFNNPFHGAVLTFQHRQFAFDRAEVFVYPIRNIDWSQAAALTRREAQNVRDELESMHQQEQLHTVSLQDLQRLNWQLDGVDYAGAHYLGEVTDPAGQSMQTATYVFTKGDKFVRIHTFFPQLEDAKAAANPDGFARALLRNVNTPQESEFMAGLRYNLRPSMAQ